MQFRKKVEKGRSHRAQDALYRCRRPVPIYEDMHRRQQPMQVWERDRSVAFYMKRDAPHA